MQICVAGSCARNNTLPFSISDIFPVSAIFSNVSSFTPAKISNALMDDVYNGLHKIIDDIKIERVI